MSKKVAGKFYTLVLGSSGLGVITASILNPEIISPTYGIITGLCAISSALADIVKTPKIDKFADSLEKFKAFAYKLLIDVPANNTDNAKDKGEE